MSLISDRTHLQRVQALVRRQEIRFLIVGGLNTALSTLTFIVTFALFGDTVHYMGALLASYAVGISTGFVMHRRLVFDVRGRVVRDFARFVSVHLAGFAANAALLPILVEFVGLPVVLAQITATAMVTVGSYFGHLLFSFRRDAPAASEA